MNGTRAKWVVLFSTVVLAAAAAAQQPSARPETPESVWTWSRQCEGDHKLGVTVRLRHKVLYRGVLPICHGSRLAEDGRAEFRFVAGREYRIRETDLIEGDIWQAGGDTDALILGISLQTKKEILLNTLHIARPDKQTSSKLDKALFITTGPIVAR